MKKILLVFCFVLSSCTNSQHIPIDQLRLGMPIYEVEDSYGKLSEQTAIQSGQICDFIQYRCWLDNKWRYLGIFLMRKSFTPYLLTFELYPPITKEQCQLLAAKYNVTDPNELASLMSIKGLRPSKLVQIKVDERTLVRRAIIDAAAMQSATTQNAAFQHNNKTFYAIPNGTGGYIIH